jgi:nicotinamide-nucleotide amidase
MIDPIQPEINEAALRSLAEQLGSHMSSSNIKLACAESCTGGWLAKIITDIPGSSSWFTCSVVSYSNAAKHSLLGVPEHTLETYGAVSAQTVKAMCEGLFQSTEADMVVSISGVAGPGGGTEDKPVGLVWLGWGMRGEQVSVESCNFAGDREAVRLLSVARALENLLNLYKSCG